VSPPPTPPPPTTEDVLAELPTWDDVLSEVPTWDDVLSEVPTWDDVLSEVPTWDDVISEVPTWDAPTPSLPPAAEDVLSQVPTWDASPAPPPPAAEDVLSDVLTLDAPSPAPPPPVAEDALSQVPTWDAPPPVPPPPAAENLPAMLDWLGVTLHVSSWKRDTQQESRGRAALFCDNPLQTEDPAAERVHRWLHSRLRAGYHDLTSLLGELEALDHEYSPHQAEPRRLCVSLCGSQRALLQTQQHMAKAKQKLRGCADVSFELAADYHG